MRLFLFIFLFGFLISSCDHVKNPYPAEVNLELDTNLYPGLWSDYENNEWPTFSQNTNTSKNVLIEDFTGHKCVFCPAAAELAHQLHEANPSRVFTASMHAGPDGVGDFQTVSPPDYPLDFTNPEGVEIGIYFGENDGGFPGNPRGTVNRFNNGTVFQSPTQWTSMVSDQLNSTNLKVNLQSSLNYYPETKGAFLHVELDPIDQGVTSKLGIAVYLIEDSLIGDQKMSDNSHNSSYTHRDIHRGNLNEMAFGRPVSSDDLIGENYYINYSFNVPNQLDGQYNASNMHLLVYAFNTETWEIYQVVKQKINP
ncbi:Omp28-related outer membrane protein [Crocinitomicaceae bacterium]|nr:Omp28-related outer membrane protein [Crocinitomicaceae bacterium]